MKRERQLPNVTIPTLRRLGAEFTDQQFIRTPGLGRGTLDALAERGWIEPVDLVGMYPRRFKITTKGRDAIKRR